METLPTSHLLEIVNQINAILVQTKAILSTIQEILQESLQEEEDLSDEEDFIPKKARS